MKKNILVLGGGGFIGGHASTRFVNQGHFVRSVDIKDHEYNAKSSEFVRGDLTDQLFVNSIIQPNDSEVFDEVYQFAADMGGAGYIFTGENDANVMYNSAIINLNILKSLVELNNKKGLNQTKIFYSSSACIYPENLQMDPSNLGLREEFAYPANPDSEYGWEKLFSERLYFAFQRNHGVPVRVARFHNIFGPNGTWHGGREKSPAAICRKIAMANPQDEIEIWGDGNQTRSFLYVDECLDAVEKLMASGFCGPINIGSEEMVSINELVSIVSTIASKQIKIKHINGPLGVRGRNSQNDLIRQELGWDFQMKLSEGIEKTYRWIVQQIEITRHADGS
jgi:nucleoside-diphosphate-sugar epimerase